MPSEPSADLDALGLNRRDISELLEPANVGRQQMQGFDADYANIVQYIISCTHKIWEDKAIGLIYTHYAHNASVHLTDAELYGRDQMVTGTLRTLAAYPDLRLYGDEVIWSGNDVEGFHTSHRVTWSGHNTGHSVYGPPTGARIQRREIAHCIVINNRIVEEWSVQDETALIRQLGLDEVALAKTLAQAEADSGVPAYAAGLGEVPRRTGQMHPPISLDGDLANPAELPGLLYALVWNARMLNFLSEYYAPDAVIWVPGNRRLEGSGDLTAYILQLLAAFSDGAMQLEHVNWIGSEAEGYRVAARWTFQGTHDGPGGYGVPTGKRVRVLGISHFELQGGKIVREYMVWNEFALLKQLHWPG
ncbi:ester cyclase [Deinococcus sp. QL22]|uniref:ester cyclase n=1 Tax=Deinococcus sp. QL22 TaxID=2939437 RepID=UPI002017E8B2|nr:ester cyclase [Deinococcus sp. QL22]UQN08318.1 ester cyclase [Deinococcus sp. QL22]